MKLNVKRIVYRSIKKTQKLRHNIVNSEVHCNVHVSVIFNSLDLIGKDTPFSVKCDAISWYIAVQMCKVD